MRFLLTATRGAVRSSQDANYSINYTIFVLQRVLKAAGLFAGSVFLMRNLDVEYLMGV